MASRLTRTRYTATGWEMARGEVPHRTEVLVFAQAVGPDGRRAGRAAG